MMCLCGGKFTFSVKGELARNIARALSIIHGGRGDAIETSFFTGAFWQRQILFPKQTTVVVVARCHSRIIAHILLYYIIIIIRYYTNSFFPRHDSCLCLFHHVYDIMFTEFIIILLIRISLREKQCEFHFFFFFKKAKISFWNFCINVSSNGFPEINYVLYLSTFKNTFGKCIHDKNGNIRSKISQTSLKITILNHFLPKFIWL